MPPLKRPLEYRQFGAADGHPVIYFHGTPGAPDECEIFDVYGKAHDLTFICYDRSAMAPCLQGMAYYQRLAEEIKSRVAGKPFDIIGFSIGGFIALQVCGVMKSKVRSLHLISAAAPLEAGDFIDSMAGKAVFRLAQRHPAMFLLSARLQGWIASAFPGLLFRMLFSSAAGGDKPLAADGTFRAITCRALKICLSQPQAYARDIAAYVQPWQASLADIATDTWIWHGAEDNWSPVAMAAYLHSALRNCSNMEILDGLSHYSCLYRTVPTICMSIETLNQATPR